MDFNLRLLQHARALAQEGSFARAARTLHLTQPALSRSIQELERRTGMKLFDRDKGRVEPTDLGRVFIAHARELLGRADALDREVAIMRGSGAGSLIVGSATTPTAMFMGEAVGAFLRKNPNVGVRLVNDTWVALVAALRRRECDLIVAPPPAAEDSTGLAAQALSFSQGYFLARPGHPLLSQRELSLRDIAACRLISTGRLATPLAMLLLSIREGVDAGRSVPDVACESQEMMRHIVAATDHVMLSGLAANTKAIERGELVPLPFVDSRISVTFAIIRLDTRTLPPIADELIREVVAADRAACEVSRRLEARLLDSMPALAPAAKPPRIPRQAAVPLGPQGGPERRLDAQSIRS